MASFPYIFQLPKDVCQYIIGPMVQSKYHGHKYHVYLEFFDRVVKRIRTQCPKFTDAQDVIYPVSSMDEVLASKKCFVREAHDARHQVIVYFYLNRILLRMYVNGYLSRVLFSFRDFTDKMRSYLFLFTFFVMFQILV